MADSSAKNPSCNECGAALSGQDTLLSMCRSCRSRKLEAGLHASGDSPDPRMSHFLGHCYKAFYLAYRLGSELSKEIAASTTVAGPHKILATRASLKKNLEKQLSRVPRDTVCGAPEDFRHVRELLNPTERIMTQLTGWKLGKLSLDSLSLLATELVDHGGRGVDAVSELSGKYPVNNAYEEAWPTKNADGSTVSAVNSGEALLRATENDPDDESARHRARERLQAFAEAMQELRNSAEYREAESAKRRRWDELAEAIRGVLEYADNELAARHVARPETIENWEHLARVVEVPTETTRAGNFTARKIFACALGWADWQTIKAKLAAHAKKAQLGDEQPKEGHRAEVAEADRPATKEERRAGWIGKALMLRKGNPEMTKAEIARRVGVHPGQLSPTRFPELAALEKMLRGDTTSGHLTKDSESGFSDVEAADTDDKPDRGVQIAGSNYFREYCVVCGEPMRVLQDDVGTGARCEGCAP